LDRVKLCGKYIEIDNFIVHPDHRLKDWVRCWRIMLMPKPGGRLHHDSTRCLYRKLYCTPFYYNQGFVPKGFHFLKYWTKRTILNHFQMEFSKEQF
jgi:hypothetical protein